MISTPRTDSSLRPLTRAAAALFITGALLISSAAVSAGTAVPDTSGANAPRALVHYGDLNLTNERDAQVLYRRITVAARKVCPDYGSRDLHRAASGLRCLSETIARAVRDVGSPKLAEVEANAHRARVG